MRTLKWFVRSIRLYHSKVYAGALGFNIQHEMLQAETLSPWKMNKLRKDYSKLYRHKEKRFTERGTFYYVTHNPEMYIIALMRNPLFGPADCTALTQYLLEQNNAPFAVETLMLHKDISNEDLNSLLDSPHTTSSMFVRVAALPNLSESTIGLIIRKGPASALQNIMNNDAIADEHKTEAALAHMSHMEIGRFR